jgi:nucleoside-diphosphate-sugar epimerase
VYSYGPAPSLPVAESTPHRPTTRKARFRLEQEQLVLAAHGDTFHTLVLHLPDFYGPHADNSFANYFIDEAMAGKPATFIGKLNAQREFLFVPDVGEPLARLASAIAGSEFAGLVFGQLQRPERVRAISKAMLRIGGLFDPMMRELVEMYYLSTSGHREVPKAP